MTAWVASYRLQLRSGLDLRAARRLAPYLERLGVSHLYLSPILCATRGSTHGYDVIDPTRVDPALGGERALAELGATLRGRGMGVLLDIVPNHMAADPEGPFFDDVLAHGPASPFARWFDVAWGAPDAARHEPLRLPALGEPLARCLSRGELSLRREGAAIRVHYFERSYPLDPATLPAVLGSAVRILGGSRAGAGRALAERLRRLRALPPRRASATERRERAGLAQADLAALLARSAPTRAAVDTALRRFAAGPAGRRRLGRLLGRQPYRLEWWRRARHHLNYRRFFDVNELIGLRSEDPAVFTATHAKVLDLCGRGLLQGLRVDHVDGLLDPREYLGRLRRAAHARLPEAEREDFALLVEKILAAGEALPGDWRVDGTTGYEFLEAVGATRLEPEGVAAIEAGWKRLVRRTRSFAEVARVAKRGVLRELLRADVSRLARRLARVAPSVPRSELEDAIVETVAWLPVYRTYADERGLSARDRALLRAALGHTGGGAPARAVAALGRALLGAGRLEVLGPFQQLCGPAAAKGVEDTALYVYVPLLSRNEVGAEPDAPTEGAVARLHAANRERARRWPRALLSASTHDTKRSADVRARLDVLSEIPDRWLDAVARWRRWNAPHRRGRTLPDVNTEYLLYQTLLGIWPLPGPSAPVPPPRERRELRERVAAYMEKACREAKVMTSWTRPDPVFEAALRDFVAAVLDSPGSPFLADLSRLVAEVARPGLLNALSGTLIQLGSPGTPDLYQGDELWNFALVDPDNRRPVDFARRRRLLARVERGFAQPLRERRAFLRGLVAAPEDGRIKLHLIRATLHARRRCPSLFSEGRYRPLQARGARADHLVAFLREHSGRVALVAAPRLPHALVGDDGTWPGDPRAWSDTHLVLPRALAGRRLTSALTGERLALPAAGGLDVSRLFRTLPLALLLGGAPAGER